MLKSMDATERQQKQNAQNTNQDKVNMTKMLTECDGSRECMKDVEKIRTITLAPSVNGKPTVTYSEWMDVKDFKGITLNIPTVK